MFSSHPQISPMGAAARPSPRRLSRLLVGALGASLALTGLLPATGAGAETPGASLVIENTLPASQARADMSVLAGTRSSLVRLVRGAYETRREYSLDSGVTWRRLPDEVSSEGMVGYGGRFLSLVLAPDDGDRETVRPYVALQAWDPTTGELTIYPGRFGELDEHEWVVSRIVDWVGSTVTVAINGDDLQVFDLSSGDAVRRTMAFPAWPKAGVESRAILLSTNGYAVSWGQVSAYGDSTDLTYRNTGYVSVAPLSTGVGATPVAIAGLLDARVSGTKLHTLIGSFTTLKACVSDVRTPNSRSCRTVTTGDYRLVIVVRGVSSPGRGVGVELAVSAGAQLIGGATFKAAKVYQVYKGVVTVFRPGSSRGLAWLDFRDPARPLLERLTTAGGDRVYRVTTSATLATAFRAPLVAAEVRALALTSGLVAAIDGRGSGAGLTLWQRRLVAGSPTAEKVIKVMPAGLSYGGEDLYASGGRVVARTPRSPTYYVDLGQVQASRPYADGLPTAVSGPYVQVFDTVRGWDWTDYGKGEAIFGSLVARRTDGVLSVRDLTKPGQTPATVTVPLPSGYSWWATDGMSMWGDWVGIGAGVWGDKPAMAVVAVNYRTQEVVEIPISPEGSSDRILMGDGFVVVPGLYRRRPAAYAIPDGSPIPIPATALKVTTDRVARLGWVDPATGQIVIARVPGMGTSGPRLLGVLAKSTFRATGTSTFTQQVDASKGLSPGVLEIRNSAGTLVRTLTSSGTSQGALRGSLTWDGRNSAGSLVPAGVYRMTLKAQAIDGSGSLTDVTGQGSATWTVSVTR